MENKICENKINLCNGFSYSDFWELKNRIFGRKQAYIEFEAIEIIRNKLSYTPIDLAFQCTSFAAKIFCLSKD